MKNKKQFKISNKIKLTIAVCIILLLLLILFANKNRLFKTQKLANNEYAVTINNVTLDISNLITTEPNTPVLGAGMIPIKWDKSIGEWVLTDKQDPNWYNYKSGAPATIMLSNRLL